MTIAFRVFWRIERIIMCNLLKIETCKNCMRWQYQKTETEWYHYGGFNIESREEGRGYCEFWKNYSKDWQTCILWRNK